MKFGKLLSQALKKHIVLTVVILVYAVIFAVAAWYMDKTGDTLEWASLMLLCPALIGIAVGMARAIKAKPEKYATLRPRLLVFICILTSGVCIYESILNLINSAA